MKAESQTARSGATCGSLAFRSCFRTEALPTGLPKAEAGEAGRPVAGAHRHGPEARAMDTSYFKVEAASGADRVGRHRACSLTFTPRYPARMPAPSFLLDLRFGDLDGWRMRLDCCGRP